MDLLRSTLQPISQNLPRPVHDAAIALLGRECHQTLLVDLDLTSSGCVKLAVSKGLGVGIIAASAVVKVPQILKLVSSRSAAGVSFLSYLLETVAFVVSLAYNARQGFPFSTYGETALIAAQNVVIAVLVLALKGRASAAAAFVAGLAAALYALLFKGDAVVDLNGLKWLQAGAGVLGVASKAPQIWTVWKEGGTGQLSAFAVRFTPFLRNLRYHKKIPNQPNRPSGLQLPRRLSLPYLHHPARSRRQTHLVWLRRRLHPQRRPRRADALLLEQSDDDSIHRFEKHALDREGYVYVVVVLLLPPGKFDGESKRPVDEAERMNSLHLLVTQSGLWNFLFLSFT